MFHYIVHFREGIFSLTCHTLSSQLLISTAFKDAVHKAFLHLPLLSKTEIIIDFNTLQSSKFLHLTEQNQFYN